MKARLRAEVSVCEQQYDFTHYIGTTDAVLDVKMLILRSTEEVRVSCIVSS